MKKLLGIIVLGLLWCNVGFAEEKKKPSKEFPEAERLCLEERGILSVTQE